LRRVPVELLEPDVLPDDRRGLVTDSVVEPIDPDVDSSAMPAVDAPAYPLP
jgi:hypothetical protein